MRIVDYAREAEQTRSPGLRPDAARHRINAVVIVGNVAQNPPAQLRTNDGALTFHLVPQATYKNHPAYIASLQLKPYTYLNHLATPVEL